MHARACQCKPEHASASQSKPVDARARQFTPEHASARQCTPVHASQMHQSNPSMSNTPFQVYLINKFIEQIMNKKFEKNAHHST
jgi:hypothetical protein